MITLLGFFISDFIKEVVTKGKSYDSIKYVLVLNTKRRKEQ